MMDDRRETVIKSMSKSSDEMAVTLRNLIEMAKTDHPIMDNERVVSLFERVDKYMEDALNHAVYSVGSLSMWMEKVLSEYDS